MQVKLLKYAVDTIKEKDVISRCLLYNIIDDIEACICSNCKYRTSVKIKKVLGSYK